MKKILAIILTVFMALQMIPFGVLAEDGGSGAEDGFSYSVNDGGATVDGYNGSGTEVIIPDELGGYPVTGVGAEAFKDHRELVSVTIPETVSLIGSQAFYGCTGLQTVYYNAVSAADLQDDSNAFYSAGTGNVSGMTVIFGGLVQRIPAYLFYTVYDDTTIPEIEDSFRPGYRTNAAGTRDVTCYIGLTSVRIPVSVTTIGSNAFNTCEKLTDVFYEGTEAEWLGIDVGSGNTKLLNATLHCEGDEPEDQEFTYSTGADGITVTAYNGTGTEVVIPGEIDGYSVTGIGARVFYNRTDLISVTIPESVKMIGDCAFYGCTALTTVRYNAAEVSDLSSLAKAFYKAGTETDTGMRVFFGDSVTRIPAYLFYSPDDTETPEVDDGIGAGIRIRSAGTRSIDAGIGLTEVTVPTSVTSIGSNAFNTCEQLTDVYYGGTRAEWEQIAVANGNNWLLNATIHYTGSETEEPLFTYRTESGGITVTGYTGTAAEVVIPGEIDGYTVIGIGARAFYNRDDLVSVTIPESVTAIGGFAFYGCTRLATVWYNAVSVANLNSGSRAFEKAGTGTENGMKVIFGETVRRIPAYLFYTTADTETPEIEDRLRPVLRVTGTGTRTVSAKVGLTEAVITAGVTEIGSNAFYNCTDLTEVTIPGSAEILESYAFGACSGLTSVTFENRYTAIHATAFSEMSLSAEICGIDCSTAARFAAEHGFRFRSTGTAEHVTDPDDPGTVVREPSCEEEGCLTRTCTVCGAAVESAVPATGHRWGAPSWNWSDDGGSASAVFTCENDHSHVRTVEADVTVQTVDATPTATGLKTCTASATFEGTEYTDIVEEILPVLDTTYTLTYDANGGTGAPETQTVTNNTLSAEFTVSSTVPVRPGYTFRGWSRIEDAEVPMEETTVRMDYPETDLVLYAVWEVNVPAFKSQSLVLSGQIGLNFFLELPEIPGVDYTKSYMTFTIGQDQTEYRDDFDPEHMNGAHTRYGFTCFVNSIQMADTITATFHYGDGQTVSKEYSVVQYIDFFEKNIGSFNQKTITLIQAIADFGHYEQIYLADVNGWTLGEKYAEMTTFYTTEFDYDAILSKVDGKAFVKELDGSGVTKATYKLHLDSETTVDVFLTPKSGVTLTASATFNGKTYAAEKQKDGRYLVQIPNISAHQLGDMITVTGNAGGAFTVKVSALSYVRSVLKSDSTNKAAKDGMSALYEYYAAVLAYRK